MVRLYISGTPTGSDRFLREEAARATHRLYSLHGNYLNAVMAWVEKARAYDHIPRTVLLDSGAFTAWNQGHKTTVDEVKKAYSTFLNATKGMFEEVWAINLDVIPGERGRDPTPEEIAAAVLESDENLRILQDTYGDIILPVFHQGESSERLDEVCEQTNFVCISPRNDLAETQRTKWAHEVHQHTGTRRTHGLATTGMLMLTAPWYSVDSATSIHVAAFGMLIFYVDNTLKKIFVTLDSDKHKDVNKHLDTLNPYFRDRCMAIIENDIFSLEELRRYVKARVLFNIRQLTAFAENTQQVNVNQISLFGV